jgi:16S rRNA (adenine1518-N6/adenine1519-N6)-dimethyltransferase
MEKKHNKLALLTNSFFVCERIMDIAPDAFDPRPRVMSSMIRLTPIKRNELKNSFKKFIFRELFFNRDRKLKNNLMESLIEFVKLHDKKLTKKESKSIIESYDLPKSMLNKKMENLSNEEYDLLYEKLK